MTALPREACARVDSHLRLLLCGRGAVQLGTGDWAVPGPAAASLQASLPIASDGNDRPAGRSADYLATDVWAGKQTAAPTDVMLEICPTIF